MRYKKFGSTGKRVSILGFGGMRFDPENERLAVETVQRAVERGINYFDTAPGYCQGRSEGFIGRALSELPKEKQKKIYTSTKSVINADPTSEDVERRIDSQLKALRQDHIDFYQMWCIMDIEHFRRVMAPGGPYEGAQKAKDDGRIRHICASTHADAETAQLMIKEGVFEGLTVGYNILNQSLRRESIVLAFDSGLGVVTMNPLGGGILAQKSDVFRVFEDMSSSSFVEAGLRFNLSHREIAVVLSGMKNPDEVEANVRTAESVRGPNPALVRRMIRHYETLGESFCTGCRYCLEHCPEDIQIPLYASLWDKARMGLTEEARRIYQLYLGDEQRWFKGKRAVDCSACGECEKYCTQKLSLRDCLAEASRFFDETNSG